ncbi:uncharacterized protein G2W53_037844 [Senna tora]|uniref:Uncharacterized protein n=1 Tax=Senna tora TaxID=362788 RepID=A0A834W1G8_9FABA|nr:uncharacterized protein G2W53_037844 [Senna tora]
MRDVISCFSENAVSVSHSSCSSYSFSSNACISSPTLTLTPSIQNSVSCVYKITLSTTQTHHFITITWCKTHSNQGLTVNFNHDDPIFRLNTNSRFFRKKKGSKFLESGDSKMEFFWDLSNAKYDSSTPEPIDGYYLVILVDSEIALVLGDMAEEIVSKKFKSTTPMAKSSLICRREHCSGNTLYGTKAQFSESGDLHEIVIRCSGENEGLKIKCPVLSVCIDKKTVIKVKRLQWNFRGNQTIFVDGLLVDLLWDVHDWFFNPSSSSSGCAVFMFRTRSGFDSRLWLEEKNAQKEKDRVEFSLLIYACKTI